MSFLASRLNPGPWTLTLDPVLFLFASIVTALLAVGCRGEEPEVKLQAVKTDSALQLVGGPSSMGQIGDFLLQNDKLRIVIGDINHSWSFGIFGGSLIDIDLVRPEAEYRNGTGLDAFAELFPTVNLLTPNPQPDGVEILADGSDGESAEVRVTGEGAMMFDILKILGNDLLSVLFKELKMKFYFETVYRLQPGNQYVEIETAAYRQIPADEYCGEFKCDKACDGDGEFTKDSYKLERQVDSEGVAHICPVCECDEGRELEILTGSRPMLEYIAGDNHPLSETLAGLLGPLLGMDLSAGTYSGGLVGGDFLFFGAKTNVFLPGLGFDEARRIFDDLYEGRDSLTYPMAFDFAAAVGKNVSYVYFTKDPEGAAEGVSSKILIPLITSSATVVVGSGAQCLQSDEDDAECDDVRRWNFTRYLAVGEGDVGSALDVFYGVKNGIDPESGDPNGVGRVSGLVMDESTGAAISHADVFLISLPPEHKMSASAKGDGTCDSDLDCTKFKGYSYCYEGQCFQKLCPWDSYEDLLSCNVLDSQVDADHDGQIDRAGMPGIVNHWQTDVGTDPVHDGRFGGYALPGEYMLVAREKDNGMSQLYRITVEEGETTSVYAVIPSVAKVVFRVEDEKGNLVPAKLTFISLDPGNDLQPLRRDGVRKVELGDSRYQDGIRKLVHAKDGSGTIEIEPGFYRVVVSRGIEYSIYEVNPFVAPAGQEVVLTATVYREVDTSGWVGGDFHLHAMPSMDSGLPLETRVIASAVEGLELVVSSDHDVLVDYEPYIRELGLEHWLTSMVGTELSTMELGHFNAYPLRFDHMKIPDYGAIDWICMGAQEIFDSLREIGQFGPEHTIIQANHPTDGVMGYFSQMGLDQFTLDRPMQVFGMDISGVQTLLDDNWNLVETFAKSDPALQHFLDNNEIDVRVLPNPAFRKVSCDFDAMELMNAKRFEFLRIPTVREVNDFNRCVAEIRLVGSPVDPFDKNAKAQVLGVCKDLQVPAECDGLVEDLDLRQHCRWAGNMVNELEDACDSEEVTVHDCKEAARFAFAKYAIRHMLQRTVVEQNDRFISLDEDPGASEFCSLEHALAMDVPPENLEDPCTDRYGVIDLWFRLLNHGLFKTGMGNSDSHGVFKEAGLPRTYVRSSTDRPDLIDIRETVVNLKAGNALSTTGPFVTFEVEGGGPGDTVIMQGDTVDMKLKIQTPSWFGVDRVEIYRNGYLERVLYVEDFGGNDGVLAGKPEEIVDYHGILNLGKPAKDSWYVVVAMGLDDEHLMTPVYGTLSFGHLLLPEIVSLAFAAMIPEGFSLPMGPVVPDYFPVFPFAITNPVFVDLDGGGYNAPKGYPLFCEHECKPKYDEEGNPTKSDCPEAAQALVCLKDDDDPKTGQCGLDIKGECVYESLETQYAPLILEDADNPFIPIIPRSGRTHTETKQQTQAYLRSLMLRKLGLNY